MNKLIRVVLMSAALGCSFAFVVGEAVAGAYDDGVAAYVQGDYATALKDYLIAAQTGDAWAQYQLGSMYYSGLGVTQDYERSYMWYSLSADGGRDKGAKNRDLVAAEMTPAQIAQAQAMAAKCKASNYQNCDASMVIGAEAANTYNDGVAALQQGDYATALKVWLSLAQAGDATAQNGVGMIYEGALGVAQDKVRSYMWFRLAAAQGEPNGAKNEKIVAANLTPAQLAQAKAMATKCKASGYKDCGE